MTASCTKIIIIIIIIIIMYSLGTWFVSGICVWIPYIKETMMMMVMMMMMIIIVSHNVSVRMSSSKVSFEVRECNCYVYYHT
jgi:hypothetical protein